MLLLQKNEYISLTVKNDTGVESVICQSISNFECIFYRSIIYILRDLLHVPYKVGTFLPLTIVFLEWFCPYLYEFGLVFNDIFFSVEMTILSLIPNINSTT